MSTKFGNGVCSTCPRADTCGYLMSAPGWEPGDPNPHGGFGPDHMTYEMREAIYGTADLCAIYNNPDLSIANLE